MKPSIFARVTQQIVEAIEAGADEYVMPWHRIGAPLDCPTNAVTGHRYRGLNVVTLWIEGGAAGFKAGRWATYKQWSSIGAQVRKGERGSPVFFWQNNGRNADAEADEGSDRRRPGFVARGFTVFNADQVLGYEPDPVPLLCESERRAQAEDFVRATGADIRHGGDRAYYSPGFDRVQMPNFGQFHSPAAYYGVLTHELVHWTGAKHRLDRNLSQRFGSFDYAMEELVAELGAAFTCAQLGWQTEPRRDHAPYIASWLKALRGEPRAIFFAASKAQQAADFLVQQGQPVLHRQDGVRPNLAVGDS